MEYSFCPFTFGVVVVVMVVMGLHFPPKVLLVCNEAFEPIDETLIHFFFYLFHFAKNSNVHMFFFLFFFRTPPKSFSISQLDFSILAALSLFPSSVV